MELDYVLPWEYSIVMKLTLYHGSESIVEIPKWGLGKATNDYGLGFYCTEAKEMANEWAVGEGRDGYVNFYSIDLDGLTILDLNSSNFNVLHWLTVLLENRIFVISSPLAFEAKAYLTENYSVNYNDYDLIKGYRADDSYFSFAQDFISGSISLRQLSEAMRLGNLGEQIVLKSKLAFERIVFTGYEISRSDEWFDSRRLRDSSARRQYLDTVRYGRRKDDLFIAQIIDEGIKGNDPRLR